MSDNLFSPKLDTELYRAAEGFARAQEHLAASAKEDREHWHHIVLRDLIMELANRMISVRFNGEDGLPIKLEG